MGWLRRTAHLTCLLVTYVATAASLAITPPLNDPMWKYQWYLNPDARGYNLTLNVLGAWRAGITGAGIKVAIVDQGVKHNGGDLDGQVIETMDHREWCWSSCMTSSGDHGSKAAGVVAMAADNNQCGAGIAPQASIVDVPIFGKTFPSPEVKGKALMSGLQDPGVDIFSNSWGTFDGGASLAQMPSEIKNAIRQGVEQGRGGKGALYVWAAGNGGVNGDSCAYDAYVNSRMTVSLTGVNYQGSTLGSSEKCSAIMAAAPSRSSRDGYYTSPVITPVDNTGCTYTFSESSAAAAMGSGVLALVLQTNPDLTWRDVQHLIPLTSNPCIADDAVTNGYGLKFSHSVGFGMLNAGALVEAARGWESVGGEEVVCRAVFYPRRQPGVRSGTIVLDYSDVSCDGGDSIGYLEHVTLDITASPLVRGGMKVNITSPARTKSITFPGRWQDMVGSPSVNLTNWQVLSYAFWGESLVGDVGTHWSLKFSGVESTRITRLAIEFRGLSSPPSRLPSTIQPCHHPSSTLLNDHALPEECQPWSVWGECSRSCGDGTRTRRRYCKREEWEEKTETGSCNEGACPEVCPDACTSETEVSRGECDTSCGAGFRRDLVDCSIRGQDEALRCYKLHHCTGLNCPNLQHCPSLCYEERNANAQQCSAVCGEGTQRQVLECKVWRGNFRGRYVWQPCFRDASCQGDRCNETATEDCPGGVNLLSDWTSCTASCGGGTQMRTARCYGPRGTYTDVYQTRRCNQQECVEAVASVNRLNCATAPIEGPWAACSVTCGETGLQRREVQCVNNVGLTVSTIERRGCLGMPPCPNAGSANCVTPTGAYYPWSTCSTTCGPGERSRVYKCQTEVEDVRNFLETQACEVEPCVTTTAGTTTEDTCEVLMDRGCQPANNGCTRMFVKLCNGQQFVGVQRCDCP